MTRLHKTVASRMERAVQDYRMIQPGERILVGVSGGPDSLSLLKLLSEGLVHAPRYSVLACHVDLGFEEPEPRGRRTLETHFQSLAVPYRIVRTSIARNALDGNATKNPCFICSMFRRKEIYRVADEEGCRTIAYGHHQDDVVETLLINILYGRRIGTMHPVQEVFQGHLRIIRPFVYVEENLLKRFASASALPVLPRCCPMDGQTRRQRVKELIRTLQRQEPRADIRRNIFRSLYHVSVDFPPPPAEPPPDQLDAE